MVRALLIVDHGSRVAVANESVGAVATLLRTKGEYDIVLGAHMELAAPDIATALGDAVRQGAADVTVVPFMLAPGRHATEDIPRLVAEAASQHAGVTWRVTAPLGVHDLLAQLVLERAREAQPPGSGG
ncbi:MAG: cobalamin biosynthesis protein CbiX [Sandaracinaceae bacterium]|nr:cobalamin biosynthesis protein CbiX [Sandaracinaceae bacterium]MBP7682101.1 cobalamin biosynthesis protein CbiX [Deltaproteobacteria bacterium]MBK6811812.1 cobalamin biosynthesis protein CbiX [Sandaracinaceae bacterium]MBK7151623.1 cobalamin biosynthesis protein CbiX [Sandaracinaceae bacterium]MBK7775712.1 cobalamin biosynthesis protein CbiX [Sandaracinaceae bacterium]